MCLTVRSDNLSTLALVAKMQPHSPQLGVIARELALDVADAAYAPDVVQHLPGVANTCADALSRQHSPEKHYARPAYLLSVSEQPISIRDIKWWRSLSAPLGRMERTTDCHPISQVQY